MTNQIGVSFPWYLVYVVTLVVPYLLLGSSWHWLFYLILTPLVFATTFIGGMVLHSRWVRKKTNNSLCKSLQHRYGLTNVPTGQRIPIDKFYEQYIRGESECNNVLKVLEIYREDLFDFVITKDHLKYFFGNLLPEMLHSVTQDKEQVTKHYNRGNDFYEAFLGPSMVYTCAEFDQDFKSPSLEDAQLRKLDSIFKMIKLNPTDKVLDLGCGWGTLLVEGARRGADMTGVTIAEEQANWANEQIERAKLTDRARVVVSDYRNIDRNVKYDKITCLEMSEHVGIRKYPQFLAQVRDQLRDDGVFYLQIAGLRYPWRYEDLVWGMFMGKYIFPGAEASLHLGWVVNQLEAAGFEVRSTETVGVQYSHTIRCWHENWMKNKNTVVAKYGQYWWRLWEWFLAWSVVIAKQGSSTCYRIVCHKNTNEFDRRSLIRDP